MPKRLLRGIIDFGGIPDTALVGNFRRLTSAHFEWTRPVDQKIFDFIKGFFEDQLNLPAATVVKEYFSKEEINDIEVLERLKDVESSELFVRQNFGFLLTNLIEEQNKAKAIQLIKETQEIITKGRVVGKGKSQERLHGIKDGLIYLTRNAQDLIPTEYTFKTRGDLRHETDASWNSYQDAKNNKDKVWGCLSGFEEWDRVCKGVRRGELWIHAAAPGHLKTSLALNWCYYAVTRCRTNILYLSLEMKFDQITRLIHVLHSANRKWKLQGKDPLDHSKVRDGGLSPEDEEYYKEVLKDFKENSEHCRFEVIAPDRDMTVDDIRIEAELLDKQTEVGMIVIDHGGLVEPKKWDKDFFIRANTVIRDAKKLALHFNHGQGVPVLMPFPINRQGIDYAKKNDGEYKLSALAAANEAERSADVITTSWFEDEYRDNGTPKICNLKNRSNPIIKPFTLKSEMNCRRIYSSDEVLVGKGMSVDNDIEQVMQGV